MTQRYIVSLDQGTSSSRAVLIDEQANITDIEQKEFEQHYPKPGWVEHDALEIWRTQFGVLQQLAVRHHLTPDDLAAIGITNQRETVVVWNKRTGEPVYNAIVWQDRRTAEFCDSLKAQGLEQTIQAKTGLVIDAYFSASKVKWILDNVDGARSTADKGNLLMGTMDTWLIWNLTDGKIHATDMSNASRTMLLNINTGAWDDELLEIFDIPKSMLPEVKNSADDFGAVEFQGKKVPIAGVAGDQQAALFGQACLHKGMAKNTYGTGCFMLMNTGDEKIQSCNGLLTTVAWSLNNKICYALEGSVFIAGAAVQWLRDELQIIDDAQQTEVLAKAANELNDVVVVPAFAGLGAPHWDMYARGAIFGLTRDSGREEIAAATLQSLAFQSYDVLQAMQQDCGFELAQLNVDGGAIANDYLAQFQADIIQAKVSRPECLESTALGAGFLAGMQIGIWPIEKLAQLRQTESEFVAQMPQQEATRRLAKWHKAVQRAGAWVDV